MEAVFEEVAAAYWNVLGSRLMAIAVHGSAVTGDAFAGLSDIDFVVVLDSPLRLTDSEAIAARIDPIDIAPFAYVQATYHEAAVPVPSACSLLFGDLGDGFLHTDGSLRSAGESWLEDLPQLVDQDMKDWTVAVARRPRQFRLILTRLNRQFVPTWLSRATTRSPRTPAPGAGSLIALGLTSPHSRPISRFSSVGLKRTTPTCCPVEARHLTC